MTGLPSLGTQKIDIIRPGTTIDPYGNTIPDWATAVTRFVSGCQVQPFVGDETRTAGRDTVTTAWQLFAPASVDLSPLDRVVHDGLTYEVDGEISRWSTPWGVPAFIQARLRRVIG